MIDTSKMSVRRRVTCAVSSALVIVSSLILISSVFVAAAERVCIIGSGISGSSTAYFLSSSNGPREAYELHVYERSAIVGGRLAMVNLTSYGDAFEAGASIIHKINLHMKRFADQLKLQAARDVMPRSFGIYDGKKFVLHSAATSPTDSNSWSSKFSQLKNTGTLTWRYGTSLLRLRTLMKTFADRFARIYVDDFPAFTRVEDLLRHIDLYEPTQIELRDLLLRANISPLLIDELVTAIIRINYGQSTAISGLAGSVGCIGSGADLWAIEGGNRQVPEGLLRQSGATVHVEEGVDLVRRISGGKYEVRTTLGNVELFDIVVLAMPLDEGVLRLDPPVTLPARKMQHTYTTFVVGRIDQSYFNLEREDDLPGTIATMENPAIPFSSIGLLKRYENGDGAFKVFSRDPPSDELLDKIFRRRSETIRIDWAAYPKYQAPEKYAPFLLDDRHLYYVNAFENAASTLETMAVAGNNIAKLIGQRLAEAGKKMDIENADLFIGEESSTLVEQERSEL